MKHVAPHVDSCMASRPFDGVEKSRANEQLPARDLRQTCLVFAELEGGDLSSLLKSKLGLSERKSRLACVGDGEN